MLDDVETGRITPRGHTEPREMGGVPQAELLRRGWGLDALVTCPKCTGRMTALAVVEKPTEIARYLRQTL